MAEEWVRSELHREDLKIAIEAKNTHLLDLIVELIEKHEDRLRKKAAKARRARGRKLTDEEMEELLSLLKQLRDAKIPYTKIAKELGVNPMSIRAWRRGERRPGIATLRKLRAIAEEKLS